MGCKLGTLSNDDDGGGSENIIKKMNLGPFKLYRINLETPNSSNVSDFSLSLILKGFIHGQIEKEQFVCMSMSSIRRRIARFRVVFKLY